MTLARRQLCLGCELWHMNSWQPLRTDTACRPRLAEWQHLGRAAAPVSRRGVRRSPGRHSDQPSVRASSEEPGEGQASWMSKAQWAKMRSVAALDRSQWAKKRTWRGTKKNQSGLASKTLCHACRRGPTSRMMRFSSSGRLASRCARPRRPRRAKKLRIWTMPRRR